MRLCKLETPQTIGFVAKMSSRLKLISSTILNDRDRGGLFAHPTRILNPWGTGILPVVEKSAKCELKPTAIVKQSYKGEFSRESGD